MPRGKTKFDKCVKAVSKRGGAYDPKAVCGAMRAEGRLNPARVTQRDVNAAAASYHNNLMAYGENNMATQRAEFQYRDLQRRYAEQQEKRKAKGNPADTAAEAFKRFHGQEPQEFVMVTKRIHYHRYLFSVGALSYLKIKTEDGQSIVTLDKFGQTILAANEQAFADLVREGHAQLTQLFIEGGNQDVDLRDFGIDPNRAHEIETLGKATKIGYDTVKIHLGPEGGAAVYEHKFRTTRQGDQVVTLRVAKYPDVIYRVLDKQLEFSGGSYEIRAEGIDK